MWKRVSYSRSRVVETRFILSMRVSGCRFAFHVVDARFRLSGRFMLSCRTLRYVVVSGCFRQFGEYLILHEGDSNSKWRTFHVNLNYSILLRFEKDQNRRVITV